MLLTTLKDFKELSYSALVSAKCDMCHNDIIRSKDNMLTSAGGYRKLYTVKTFCGDRCKTEYHKKNSYTKCICKNCSKDFLILNGKINRGEGLFCSQSCAATYNNTHKTHGYRRSKLEAYIEESLKRDYPNLQILFNDKTTIDSELDIYIPSLRLAFELNGIFHYEPIYSDKQFNQIQNNDKQKIIKCYQKGVELCVIDSSQLKYFKPSNAEKYYLIVKNILDTKIGSQGWV